MELGTWALENPVPNQMNYKGAAQAQIDKFWKLAKDLGVTIKVVGDHTSKSCKLPVVELTFPGKGRILIRDNFHSVEIAVQWNFVPALTYADVYKEAQSWDNDGHENDRDWAWYCREIERCENYSWKGWSAEELADPRITRVEVSRSDGSKYWVDTRPEEKDRWAKRWTDPEWHHKQWAGRIFYDGVFGPTVKMYLGSNTFLEGISELIPYTDRGIYEKGKQNFTVSTSWDDVSGIIDRIRSAPNSSNR